jgi:hypothetical protein
VQHHHQSECLQLQLQLRVPVLTHGRHLTELSRLADEQISGRTETSLPDDSKRCTSCNTRKPRGDFQGARLSIALCLSAPRSDVVSQSRSVSTSLWWQSTLSRCLALFGTPFAVSHRHRLQSGFPTCSCIVCLLSVHPSYSYTPRLFISQSHTSHDHIACAADTHAAL